MKHVIIVTLIRLTFISYSCFCLAAVVLVFFPICKFGSLLTDILYVSLADMIFDYTGRFLPIVIFSFLTGRFLPVPFIPAFFCHGYLTGRNEPTYRPKRILSSKVIYLLCGENRLVNNDSNAGVRINVLCQLMYDYKCTMSIFKGPP